MASTTSRRSVWRGRPPEESGSSGSIRAHCSSVRSLGYLFVLIPTTYEKRPLWDRLSAANCGWLPERRYAGWKGAVHNGGTPKVYIERVGGLLEMAMTKEEALNTLKDIKAKLWSGEWQLNAD